MKSVGIAGCGDISGIYIKNISKLFGDRLKVAGLYDAVPERAAKRASEFGDLNVYAEYSDMLNDPSVDIILNLTRPQAHYSVSEAALLAGKHVYSEKPLAASSEEARMLIDLAADAQLTVACAPDTFLGCGIKTCRRLIDDGAIGDIIGCTAFMLNRGMEDWHPDPEFFYKPGAGPMFDVGVYYITALVYLLGAVMGVSGITKTTSDKRVITSKPKAGKFIEVEVPTYITGLMEFETGVIGTIITSFDVHAHSLPQIEIYGTQGTLRAPDPNTFGGPVMIMTPEDEQFTEAPLLPGYSGNSRGIGLYDMAAHIEDGEPLRASGELGYHVLEVMEGFTRAYEKKGFEYMLTVPKRPYA